MIIDRPMAWKPWVTELLTRLDREHYTIHIADGEASREVAAARIVHRWQQGMTAELNTSDTDPAARMGGRRLPISAVDRLFTDNQLPDGKPLHGRSVSEVNARQISEESPAATRYDLYRTFAVEGGPEHVECRERIAGGRLQRTWGATDSRDSEFGSRTPEPEIDQM